MNKIKRMLPKNQIRAALSESSVNEEDRTIELVWTTGSKGLRRSWGGEYYEELSLKEEHVDMSRLEEGAPLLAAHSDASLDDVIGVVERAWIEDGLGKAMVRFAKDPKSDAVFQKVKDRVLRNVSVGYSVSEYTNVSEQGDEVPTYLATRWQPAEISIVPIGFDAGARTRSKEETTENEVLIITRSENSNQESEMTVKKEDLAPALDAEALKNEATKQERSRVLEIRKEVKQAKLDEQLAEDLIERGVSLEDAKENIRTIAKYAKQTEEAPITATTRVDVGADDRDKKREGLQEALLHRIDKQNFSVTEAARPFAGKSLLRMVEDMLGRYNGESDAALAKRAMSSSDLPLILANVAEKSAQKRYELAPATWKQWAKQDTLRNYKEHSQVSAGDFASLQKRKEAGEYLRGSISEKQEVAQLEDYGIIHAFTSKMLVNDDLKMIQKIASEGGVAAARLENKLAYAALTTNKIMKDSVTLYHASHGNLGTAGAIAEASVGEAFKFMRKQKTVGGLDTLNLTPKFLICGPDKEVEARKFLASIVASQTSNVNIFSNSLIPIIDAEITGNQFYFAADPSAMDTVVLFHLEGQESPRIESRVRWEDDSVELKVSHTAVAEPMDFRGLVKNAGN